MDEPITDQYPALQSRRKGSIDRQKLDEVRRILWRAFQHGSLTEDEFASTLERLDFGAFVHEPSLQSAARR